MNGIITFNYHYKHPAIAACFHLILPSFRNQKVILIQFYLHQENLPTTAPLNDVHPNAQKYGYKLRAHYYAQSDSIDAQLHHHSTNLTNPTHHEPSF